MGPGVDRELLTILGTHLGDPRVRFTAPPQGLGGSFSDVWRFELEGQSDPWSGPLVLRLAPDEARPDPSPLRIQCAVQNGLATARFPAPRVVLFDEDLRISNRRFLIAQHLPGRLFLRGVRPGQFAVDLPRLLLSWGKTAARVQTRLHDLDPQVVLDHLGDHLVANQISTTRHLRLTTARLAEFGGPGFADAIGWLDDNEPPTPSRPTVVHGDLWPGNVLYEGRELTGLIDWDRSGVGDPALDLGFAMAGLSLMPAPFPPPSPIAQGLHAAGLGIARDLHRASDRLRPLPAESVTYFQALRCALELATVVEHRARSDPPDADRPPPWSSSAAALVAHFTRMTGVVISLDA